MKEKLLELFNKHSNCYQIVGNIIGRRITDYKWTALADDIIELIESNNQDQEIKH